VEPQGHALGLKHGLLSLKAPDFSPGDVYTLRGSPAAADAPPRLDRAGTARDRDAERALDEHAAPTGGAPRGVPPPRPRAAIDAKPRSRGGP